MSKEYTLIGGNGTVVSPLEVTEDGDYVAGDSRAFNPVKVRTGGGGSSTLSGLTDVDISNPADGQTLVYNATAQKWENGAGGGGSGGGVLVVTYTLTGTSSEDGGTATCDHTVAEIGAAVDAGKLVVAKVIPPVGYNYTELYYMLSLTSAYAEDDFYFETNRILVDQRQDFAVVDMSTTWINHYVEDGADIIDFEFARSISIQVPNS